MSFGVVSGIDQEMRVLDGVEIVEGQLAVSGVNLGHPIVTDGIFSVRDGDAAHPKLLREFLLLHSLFYLHTLFVFFSYWCYNPNNTSDTCTRYISTNTKTTTSN